METIRDYLDKMFARYPSTPEVLRAKSELGQMMEDKYNELIAAGKSKNEAIGTVIAEFGDLDELIANLEGDDSDTAGENAKPAPEAQRNVEERNDAQGFYAPYAQAQYQDAQQAQPQYAQPQYPDAQQPAYTQMQYEQSQYRDAQQPAYTQTQYEQSQYPDAQAQYAQPQYQDARQASYAQPQYAQPQYQQTPYEQAPYGDDMFEDEYQYGAFSQYGMGYDGGYQAPVQYAPTLTYDECAKIAQLGKRRGFLKALGVLLCITCAIWPILGDAIPWYLGGVIFKGLGAMGLFISIAVGVLCFTNAGTKSKQIDEIRRGKRTPDPATMSMVQDDWLQISNGVSTERTTGIMMTSLCFLPTILTASMRSSFMGNLGAILLLGMVGIGVGLIIHSNAQKDIYRSLLTPMERGAYYNPNMKAKGATLSAATSGLAAGATVMANTAGEIVRTVKAKSSTNSFVTEPFSQIDIRVSRGNIELKTGNEYRVEMSAPSEASPEWGIQDGKLTIMTPQNSGFYKHKRANITITVPANVTIKEFNSHVNLGNINIKDVVVEQVKSDSVMGNVTADGVSAGILDCGSNMGNVTIKRTGAAQGRLTSSMGNVKFDGVFQHLEANTSMGNIDISTQTDVSGLVPENELILATSMGVVSVNGKKYGKSVHLPS